MVDGMQRGEKLESSLEIKRPLAIRALRRSNVRKRIAEYLFDISPSYSYTSDIAYHVRTTPSNVIGAMRGMQTRYKEEESLLNLDLVVEKNCGNNIRLYGITDFGKEMLKTIKDRR
jgi:predicted transcriptional regulator with HTH domain